MARHRHQPETIKPVQEVPERESVSEELPTGLVELTPEPSPAKAEATPTSVPVADGGAAIPSLKATEDRLLHELSEAVDDDTRSGLLCKLEAVGNKIRAAESAK